MFKKLSVLAAVILTGCFSGGPSENDAREAMMPTLRAAHNGHMQFNPGSRLTLEDVLKSFKLGGCKQASDEPGYRCDVSWRSPDSGQTINTQCRFVKEGEHWRCRLGT